jgi:magnesium-transporting ATPase (P-type)
MAAASRQLLLTQLDSKAQQQQQQQQASSSSTAAAAPPLSAAQLAAGTLLAKPAPGSRGAYGHAERVAEAHLGVLFMSTTVQEGHGRGVVVATGMHTDFGRTVAHGLWCWWAVCSFKTGSKKRGRSSN